MSSTAPDSSQPININLPLFLVATFTVLALSCLLALYLTQWDFRLGQQLGVNLPNHPSLKIYSAICRSNTRNPVLNITYWTPQSAPISLDINKQQTAPISALAGINTLDITLRNQTECPKAVILTDQSRGRRTGSGVEIIK